MMKTQPYIKRVIHNSHYYENLEKAKEVKAKLDELLVRDDSYEVVVLGCTHYPLIRSTLGRIAGDNVTLVNPAYETARELKELLEDKDLLNNTVFTTGILSFM